MSRDLVVFARKEPGLSPDEILEALGAEGIEAEWRADPAPARAPWRTATVQRSGSDDHVDLTIKGLRDYERTYLRGIERAGPLLPALAESRSQYTLTIGKPGGAGARTLQEALARAIATLADGVIHDADRDRYYLASERPGRGSP